MTKTVPESKAIDVEPAIVEILFSQPMNVDATNKAFALVDTATGMPVGGFLNWNDEDAADVLPGLPVRGWHDVHRLVCGRRSRRRMNAGGGVTLLHHQGLRPGGRRGHARRGNDPGRPRRAPSGAGHEHGRLRAQPGERGTRRLRLRRHDPGRVDFGGRGRTRHGSGGERLLQPHRVEWRTKDSRLRAGGVSFHDRGENQCYLEGRAAGHARLGAMHSSLAEPYPGHWNHIGNILDPRFHRMGVGIASCRSPTVIVWDFTD